ncbi:hypothetical protein CC86DRAFT_458706 [Ophiobolus disseminans]|uniref:BRCT domain-containing protein n=1 Tax=Ophiobolus disseminans TaxID=1469910 RepID=A0A6A6ZMB0_9PLEO|nr:hypothetical protein CC86DRAFT_458706 [Ophiobolus disseminans]
MSWALVLPKGDASSESTTFRVPEGCIGYIVQTVGRLGFVHEFRRGVCTELGRITITPSGAKLEAIDHVLNVLPAGGHAKLPSAAQDPRVTPYELKPRGEERSEVIFLRHGDTVSSLQANGSIVCTWIESKVQVNSSAADVTKAVETTDGVAETPEEETEDKDKDLDDTVLAVGATQSKSQPQATPQLSHQRSIIVQETPTAARTNTEIDQPTTDQAEVQPYSTARTRHSQNVMQEYDGLALAELTADDVEDTSEDTPPKTRHPKVLVARKRAHTLDEPMSDTEATSRSKKRVKLADDNDTQDSCLSTVAVDTSPVAVPAKGRKREVEESETPSRSQRSQRSNSAATSEVYQGELPRVATSNSAITDKGQAAKFLKKQGGSFIDSVKEPFNILCVRDGDLHKTPKVLLAIATGTPIVTDKWLSDSAKAGHFLSIEAYRPSAPKREKDWGFVLKDILGQAQTPFDGYTVHFTTSLHSTYKLFTEIEQVCKAAGARVTKKKMNKSKSENMVILAMEESDKEAEKLIQDGYICYTRDLLPTSILRGALDLDSDEFKITGRATKDAKKTRGKES